MKWMVKYSNGWGHLIMSVLTMLIGCFLYVKGVQGLGLQLIGVVVAAWFIPSAAKQMAHQIAAELLDTKERTGSLEEMKPPLPPGPIVP